MTRNSTDGDITTQEEFDSALGQVLLEAIQNNIDPRGSWVYRNGQSAPNWEIMVYELEKTDETQ